MMKIRTTVEIVDDEGTSIETRNQVEAGILTVDAFNNKEKLLEQFDVIEKAVIQSHKEAATQALTDYFDEASKKKTPKGAKVKTSMLDSEIGRIPIQVWGKLRNSLQPKERMYARSVLDFIMPAMATVSDRKATYLVNRAFHREGDDAFKLRTMTDLCERIGAQISAASRDRAMQALEANGFSPATGQPLPETQLPLSITNPDIYTLSEYDIYVAECSVRNKNKRVMLPELTETFEDPMMTCYVAVDDIGVKKQKATRKNSEPSPGKRKYVENTVVKVMSDDEEEILTGIGMTGVFMMLLGFLLHNQLLVNQSLIFFTDGAKNIRAHIKDFFGFRPYRIILDWYHLQKKCGEYLSMAIKGTKNRNEILERLKALLWVGDVKGARVLLKYIDDKFIKDQRWIDKLDAYFEKNTEFIPCYAVRAELKLKNSSSPVEKANDLVVADRQKHNGMSWSSDGSGALASIRAILENGELQYWIENRTVSFTMHHHFAWADPYPLAKTA